MADESTSAPRGLKSTLRAKNGSDDGEGQATMNMSLASVESKIGRPAIQDQWTRVIHVTYGEKHKVSIHILATELLLDDGLPLMTRNTRSQDWTMFFNPTHYWDEHPGLTIEKCRLSQAKLKQYAK